MNIDFAAAQHGQTLGNISDSRASLEAEALAWASQKGAEMENEAMAFIQSQQAMLEQRAAEWMAAKQAELEQQALAWRARQEAELKLGLDARLAELKKRERAKAATEMEKLRAVIKTHESAAQTQQEGAKEQSTQVQSLKESLADKNAELAAKTSSNNQLQQELETSKLEVMSGRLWGSRKDVEIASLRQEKSNIVLQGRSIIAARDAMIKDLQDQVAAQSRRLSDGEAEKEKLSAISNDLAGQVEKAKVNGSKVEEKLKADLRKYRAEIRKVRSQLARCQTADGSAEIADSLSALGLGTPSSSSSTGTANRSGAGGVNLGQTAGGRIGIARPQPSTRSRRRLN